jgi:hypothetical protein
MSRKDPRVLLVNEPEDTTTLLQICESGGQGLYVVLYKGKPFQLRTKYNREVVYPGWKYSRTSFAGTAAHACRLAKKLNALFETTEFTVSEMTYGRNVPMN